MGQKMNQYTWDLSDPGMDLLERAGLAGLHMALTAATEAGRDLSPLTWTDADLTDESVTVRWTGPPKEAFQKLIEWAWQVRDGVLYFPAVHEQVDAANWYLRVPMHNGIMGTFLQHPKVQSKGELFTRIVRLDEGKELAVSYRPPVYKAAKPKKQTDPNKQQKPKKPLRTGMPSPLKPHRDFVLFFRGEGLACPVKDSIKWFSPGMARRYGDETNWVGSSDRALLLSLAPTVCLYLHLQGKGNNWVVVVPDVRDLNKFADARRLMHLPPDFIKVSSLGDAGLRFLAAASTQSVRRELEAGCRVLAMGQVSYYGKRLGQELSDQAVRKAVLDVPAQRTAVRRYRLLYGAFENFFYRPPAKNDSDVPPTSTKRRGKPRSAAPVEAVPKGNGWYKLPTGRGRIADNLVHGRPWYRDLFVPLMWDEQEVEQLRKRHPGTSIERIWFNALSYQKEKLVTLIDSPEMWDDPRDRVFVEAFWRTLRGLYHKEAKAAAERGGSRDVRDRWKHLVEDVRRKLMEAKTQRTSRAALAELFALAGTQPELSAHTATIWRLIDHPEHWDKGRDLALLALVTYRGKKKSTEVQPPNPTTQGA